MTDMFQRASFLSIDRDSSWDLAMCVFAIDETAYSWLTVLLCFIFKTLLCHIVV